MLIQIDCTFNTNLHEEKINIIFNLQMFMCTAHASTNFYNLNQNTLESNFPFTAGAVLLFSRSFSRLNLHVQLIYKASFLSNSFFERKFWKSAAAN